MSHNGGDEKDLQPPLHRLQAFGSCLKRKHIHFVPETSASAALTKRRKSKDASDLYLSIVLPGPDVESRAKGKFSLKDGKSRKPLQREWVLSSGSTSAEESEGPDKRSEALSCPICNGLILDSSQAGPHEATLSHQLALEHSHPPSSIDRQRKGLAIMESYGWDPDSRQGLGFQGDGRLFPVSAVSRADNRGIGAPNENIDITPAVGKTDTNLKKKTKNLDQAKDQKMRDIFYRDEETNKYLGVQL